VAAEPSSEAPSCPPSEREQERAFSAVNAAFGSLGRACMALDAGFRVRYASDLFDQLLGPGTAARLRGAPVESLLGGEMFGPDGPLRRALLDGEKREGWRAVLQADAAETHLMSVSAAPLQADRHGVCDPTAKYLVVLRPADEATVEASGPIAGFGLIARSSAMARVFRLIDTLQQSEATVLITGESGTGKEVTARIIHAHSPRRAGPFVAVNAAALPGELLESELFGHVRGAFTGAVKDRVGRFEAANGGTLFLDEVGDVPLHLQVKLLRVLQEHTYERVGDSESRSTTARIIAATNKNLRRAVAEGTFREDLYYRLRVFPIEVPPLRARREDVEPIARLLLTRACARTGRALRLSPDAVRVLLSYEWPGNVRELENALEFAATVAQGQTVQPEDLPPEVLERSWASEAGRGHAPLDRPDQPTGPGERQRRRSPRLLERRGPAGERDAILRALEAHAWDRVDAARALGMSRSTLWRRMRALGVA
jgi:transcriptional regulator with GAF, ATPase, and Fis domain